MPGVKPLPPGSTLDIDLSKLRKLKLAELAALAVQVGIDISKVEAKSSAVITALMSHAVE